jgi:hypothetical protein
MPFHPTSLLTAAIAFALTGSAAATTLTEKTNDKRVERVEVIDETTFVQADTSTSAPEVKRRVEVFTQGPSTEPFLINGMPANVFRSKLNGEIDAVVSNALSEAFSSPTFRAQTKSIKNAPYSAEVISEKTQSLADGNQIAKRSSTLTYRDSAGRTREEVRDDNGSVRIININDTVADTRLVLNPARKTATKISTGKLSMDLQKKIDEARARAMEKVKAVREKTDKLTGNTRTHSQLSISESSDQEPVNVKVISVNGETEVSVNGKVTKLEAEKEHSALLEAMKNGPMMNAFRDRPYAAKSTTRDLGSRDFEGVRAEGKTTSYTIPAGEIGNRNPITVSTESWFAPDLQVTVYSRQSDPRYGDTIYRLTNIKRSEPAIALFGVPNDYTLKEASTSVMTSTSESQSSNK